MNLSLPSRRLTLIAGTVLLVTGLFIGLPWLSATRGVERAWDGAIEALADNDIEAFKDYLDVNYHDGFGLDREGAAALAKTIRGQFVLCARSRQADLHFTRRHASRRPRFAGGDGCYSSVRRQQHAHDLSLAQSIMETLGLEARRSGQRGCGQRHQSTPARAARRRTILPVIARANR
jgi:hypothetical protein